MATASKKTVTTERSTPVMAAPTATTPSESDKWLLAKAAADKTARWARTMTKVAIAQSSGKGAKAQPQWEVINFLGRGKAESRGIVDLLVIRKNHDEPGGGLNRGDQFDIVIIQVKGGSARDPSAEDVVRLQAVKDKYDAKAVLLSAWKVGSKAVFKELVFGEWIDLEDPTQVFSPARNKIRVKKAVTE